MTDNNINNNQTSNLRGNIRIPRQELRRILLQRLDPGTVKWGRRLVSYHDDFNEVKLEFECIDTSNQQSQQSEFEKEIVMADVVVGADGINSKIRQHRDQQNIDLNPPPLQYTGVSVIIGLSAAKHPLLTRGGFYVLDGSQRLFVMPFQEETICSCVDRNSDSKDGSESVPLSSSTSPCAVCGRGQQQLTMWQLSFAYPDSEPDLCLSSMNRISLIAEALRRTDGWMEPVQDLVRLTLPEDSAVWGTKLYDCDPMVLRPKNKQSSSKRKFNTDIQETDKLYTSSSRITVLGDACHPMSMFKGQGCNQAMEDGPLLASWLGRPGLSAENLYTRLRCFEREMISRTTPKVAGSREAAHLYHSSEALKVDFGFEGLTSQQGQTLIAELNERNITAALGMKMEPAVIKLAHEIVNVEKE